MDERLKLYIVSSHADKPIEEGALHSSYDVPIQAGAALTDQRTCAINDHDGFPESISDRNMRYSEGTAMWWVAKHLDTPYVGIAHYRRRLDLTEEEIAAYLDADTDIITSVPQVSEVSIEEDYRTIHHAGDWDLFLEILRTYAPEDVGFAMECFRGNTLHGSNVNIMKSALYTEYSDWAFPMADAFFRRSPLKTDLYQRRDCGFILERLSHVFVRKQIARGKRVVEAPLIHLKSVSGYMAEDIVCDRRDPEAVRRECDRLYREHRIVKAVYLLAEAREQDAMDEYLCELEEVFGVAQMESDHYSETMHEYLPEAMRSDCGMLIRTYGELRGRIREYLGARTPEAADRLREYLMQTHFSRIVTACICGLDGVPQEETDQLMRMLYA